MKTVNYNEKRFYVYEWFKIDTLEVFHVGYGQGKRRFDTKRAKYFNHVYNKHKDNCTVRIYKMGLTEDEARELEQDRIAELKLRGWAKTNVHIGGNGGNTIRYMNKEQKTAMYLKITGKNNPWYGKKRPEHSKKMQGKNNPMYGKRGKLAPMYGKPGTMIGADGEKNPMAKPILVLNNEEQIIKRYGCIKEVLYSSWRKSFPRPNGITYITKCLNEGLEFHNYKIIYEKNYRNDGEL